MKLELLTERERKVFSAIILSFVHTADPVGSRYLSKHFKLNLSPSSIRNVMMDLEEKGLISQPHTSAGRIPTTIGFRAYVNSLNEFTKLNSAERKSIINQLEKASKDVDLVIEEASQVLSNISSQLGIAMAPRFDKGRVEKIELVSLSNNKFLFVLGLKSGLVKTIILEIAESVSRESLEATAQLLNERLSGLTVKEFKDQLDKRFRDIDLKTRLVVNEIKKNATNSILNDLNRTFHLAGARNVLNHPEFMAKEKIEKILQLLDRKDILIRVLSEHESGGVSIVIGEENQEELMKYCSLISTTYKYGDSVGTIGVIGPTRMEYKKVIALVQFMADTLSYLINKKA